MKHWIEQLSELGFFNSISNDSVEEVKNLMLKSVSEGRLSFPDSTNRIFGVDAEELHEDGFGDALNEFGRIAHHYEIEVEVGDLYTDYDANPIVRQITVNGKVYDLPFDYKGLKDWAAAEQQYEDIVEDVLERSNSGLRLFGTFIDAQAMLYVLLTRNEFDIFEKNLSAEIENKPFVLSREKKRLAEKQNLKAMLGERLFDKFEKGELNFNPEDKKLPLVFHRIVRFLGGCIFILSAVWLFNTFISHFNDEMFGKKAKIWHLVTLIARFGFAAIFGLWGTSLIFSSFSKRLGNQANK